MGESPTKSCRRCQRGHIPGSRSGRPDRLRRQHLSPTAGLAGLHPPRAADGGDGHRLLLELRPPGRQRRLLDRPRRPGRLHGAHPARHHGRLHLLPLALPPGAAGRRRRPRLRRAPRARPRHRAAGGRVRRHGPCPSRRRRCGSGRWRRRSPSCAGCGPGNRSPTAARASPPSTPGPWGAFLPPVQEPYVPFLLAGGGEKTTLRQVARFADAANMGAHPAIGQAVSDDDIARKFGVLKSWCDNYGRPYEGILRTHFTMPLILAPTHSALETKLAAMPQADLVGGGRPLRRHAGGGHRLLPRPARARLPVLHHQPARRRRRDRRAARHGGHSGVCLVRCGGVSSTR